MPTLTDSLLGSLAFRCIGPHRGGRSVAVAGDPAAPMTFYFGACAGGVWKTTDGGTYWHNISDGFFGSAAIGAIAVSDADPNVIYVGTGETCIRNNVSHGDGVYKSTDGGRTWQHLGLRETRHIGKIRIHPHDPDTVYVAALGHAFGPNAERGVYRSRNGGQSWELVLHKSAQAGSHDISLDVRNPRILYAAIWQAQRSPHSLINGGPDSGLWKSTDGGDSWTDITRNPGLPTGVLGKIGVAVSAAQPERVWALVEAEAGALFRSDDGGAHWQRVCAEATLRTRPWYYIHVFADPSDADTCWVMNYKVWKSTDAGQSFSQLPIPHGDNHDLWIDPRDSRRMIQANDGGACITFNGGASWSSIYNQPTAQLYHVITDDQFPYRVYGSQQDNTAISVPSLGTDGPIGERDWYAPGGGESGYIAVKPDDPNIVVGSGPMNRRIFNHYMTCYDHRSRTKRDITVWPELYGWGEGAESLKYRFQWTFPILFSRHDPDALYACSNYVHRSMDLGASWEVISPDLTRNDPTKLGPSGGPVTRDNTGAEVYCTIFALVESPHEPGVMWAGSDDGLLHLSRDGGAAWTNVTPGPDLLPEWALISIIEPSPHDPATAYVAATRYKLDDLAPYALKTTDYGATWTSIRGDLPDDAFVRVIREDPHRRGLLYCGTETGLYVSFDDGRHWQAMTGTFPVVPVYDLAVKGVELVVASHGRSFWILDDLTPLHQLSEALVGAAVHLFQPRPTARLRLAGGGGEGDEVPPGLVSYGRANASLVAYLPRRQADSAAPRAYLDAGTNPPAGASILYYLRDEPAAPLQLDVLDAGGQLVRSFTSESRPGQPQLPAQAGLNRFIWNLRQPGAPRVTDEPIDPWQRDDGPMVLPGQYQLRLQVDGQTLEQSFELVPDPRQLAALDDLRAQQALLGAILAKIGQVNTLVNRLDELGAQLAAWGRWTAERADAAELRRQFESLEATVGSRRGRLIDVHFPEAQLYTTGLQEKLNALFEFVDSTDAAPAQQAHAVFDDLCQRLDAELHTIDQELRPQLAALNAQIQQAGIPALPVDLTS